MDATQDGGDEAPFVPFTTAERIQQLGEIDESVVSLLRTVGQTIQSLGKDAPGDGDVVMGAGDNDDDESSDAAVFKHNVNHFLRTLRSVNVRIKRQIWGLEEAGIVTLGMGNNEDEQPVGSKSLEPDGNGKIGGIDVGWLNSRSNKVERDMEAELWDQAEALFKEMLQGEATTTIEDSQMKG
ncbi:mediator complex protein-domain-containing protein [Xylariales sp. PMI_506]|nr:mediator complex protein-domain-containing protein [Xylariales sp. PMI_506]